MCAKFKLHSVKSVYLKFTNIWIIMSAADVKTEKNSSRVITEVKHLELNQSSDE